MINSTMFGNIREVLNNIPIDFGGGCSFHKASVMGWLINTFKLKTTLDIGVYRGRSLFPQAVAHKHCNGGIVYGVDPWSAIEASEEDNSELKDKIDDFIKTTDFEGIFKAVESFNVNFELNNNCTLIRKTSATASQWFDENNIKFDMLHIDGNHDTASVMEDLDLYLPKLNHGGFVVLDDVSWNSVKPAYDLLQKKFKLLYQKTDKKKMNDFAVFWDENSSLKVFKSKILITLNVPKK